MTTPIMHVKVLSWTVSSTSTEESSVVFIIFQTNLNKDIFNVIFVITYDQGRIQGTILWHLYCHRSIRWQTVMTDGNFNIENT